MPSLSVVVNNYNYARFVEECVLSVLPQLLAGDEMIVVDDGSTDNSLAVLARYTDRLQIISQTNTGQAAAINAGVAAATGDVLLFLDADDMFLPGKLETIRRFFAARPEHGPLCVLHDFVLVDRHGDAIETPGIAWRRVARRLRSGQRRVSTPEEAARYTDRYRYLPWPCDARTSMMCLNRAMVEHIFPLPPQAARICADEFVVRGALYSGDVHYLSRPLTAYRDHGSNGWLHGSAAPKHRAYLAPLRDFLEPRYRAAGGSARLDADSSVVTSIYVREGLSILERGRAAWAHSPRDAEAFLHIAGLMLRRLPSLVRARCKARRERGSPLPR